jgi:hypothetical protein
MADRLTAVYQHLLDTTWMYKKQGTVEAETALTVALDKARAALGSAETTGVTGLTVRLLHEQVNLSAIVLRARRMSKLRAALPAGVTSWQTAEIRAKIGH